MGGIVAALGLGTVACPPPEADERPGRPDYDESGGRPVSPVGGGTGVGGTAGSGASEGGATSTGGAATTGTGGALVTYDTTTLTGILREATGFISRPDSPSSPILNSGAHAGQVEVVAQGGDSEHFVPEPAAEGAFELDGVRKSEETWVRTHSEQDGILGVLHQVDTTDRVEDVIYVMQATALDDILTEAGSNLDFAVDKAQVMVRVMDQNRDGVEGVTVGFAEADGVLYQLLNSWYAEAEFTDDSGLAFVVNVPAKAKDGDYQTIAVGTGAVSVPVYPGVLTIVEVRAP